MTSSALAAKAASSVDFTGDISGGSDILKKAPPSISAAHAQSLMMRDYGLDCTVQLLTCERDQIFMATGVDGRRRILRIINPSEASAITDFQTKALLHIANVSPQLPVPRLVPTLGGRTETTVSLDGGRESAVRVITCLPGAPLAGAPDQFKIVRLSVARNLAHLGRALRGFFHSAAGHELLWDMKHAHKLRSLLPYIEDDALRQFAANGLDNFERRVLPRLSRLRGQIIHNDLNPSNILIDAERGVLTGMIDFGDMVYAPLVQDLAVAGAYQISDPEESDAITVLSEFVKNYHQVTPLESEELSLVYDLVVIRQILTVAITEWRAKLYPENRDYILRNHAAAVVAIERLTLIECGAVTDALLDACNIQA